MKKIIITILAGALAFAGTDAFAQASVEFGYVNSWMASKQDKDADEMDLSGLSAGFSFNIPFGQSGLGLAPGINYTLLTKKETVDWGSLAKASSTLYEHYLQAPVMLNYAIPVGADAAFRIFAGPTVSYGLASKVKIKADSELLGEIAGTGTKYKDSTDLYDESDGTYGRFDVLLGGGVAFEIYSFRIKVGYDYGMLNRYTGDLDEQVHRSQLTVGVGYIF